MERLCKNLIQIKVAMATMAGIASEPVREKPAVKHPKAEVKVAGATPKSCGRASCVGRVADKRH